MAAMWRELRYWLGTGIRWRLRREVQFSLANAHRCRERQLATFARLMRLNQDSAFTRDHRLHAGKIPADLRRSVPVSGYDYFAPYIERMKNGEHAALLGSDNKLLMFALSSGTTAASKFIPVTRQFYGDYRRGWQHWGIQAMDAHPQLHRLNIVQIAGDHDRFRTPGGVPCGNISGLAQHNQSAIVRSMYSVPAKAIKGDPQSKLYRVARFALADPHVGMIMTANPSTLVQLASLMREHAESFVKLIHNGSKINLDEPKMTELAGDSIRGKQLELAIERDGGLTPQGAWPNLRMLGVWTGGTVGCYLPLLRRLYGNVPIRDHGLHASEGRMTIPVEDETASGLLDVDSHYFEFIPEAEFGSPSPIVLEAHELQEGQKYFILLTTSSGLSRYDIHDVVECTGHVGTTPLLRFLHKGAHISSITGEKITESQVIEAVQNAANAVNVELTEFVLSPVWGEPPGYLLWIEERSLPQDQHERFVENVDLTLQRGNCEYAEKRTTMRLQPIKLRVLPAGTWKLWAQDRQSRPGGSLEQYKHPFLVTNLEFESEILRFRPWKT